MKVEHKCELFLMCKMRISSEPGLLKIDLNNIFLEIFVVLENLIKTCEYFQITC